MTKRLTLDELRRHVLAIAKEHGQQRLVGEYLHTIDRLFKALSPVIDLDMRKLLVQAMVTDRKLRIFNSPALVESTRTHILNYLAAKSRIFSKKEENVSFV